jgi:hypothetical protein
MKKGWYAAIYTLIAVSVVIATVSIAILPETVPMRWDILTGEVYENGMGSKWFHIVFPVISILTGIVVPAIDKPKSKKDALITGCTIVGVLALFNANEVYILMTQLSFAG